MPKYRTKTRCDKVPASNQAGADTDRQLAIST